MKEELDFWGWVGDNMPMRVNWDNMSDSDIAEISGQIIQLNKVNGKISEISLQAEICGIMKDIKYFYKEKYEKASMS